MKSSSELCMENLDETAIIIRLNEVFSQDNVAEFIKCSEANESILDLNKFVDFTKVMGKPRYSGNDTFKFDKLLYYHLACYKNALRCVYAFLVKFRDNGIEPCIYDGYKQYTEIYYAALGASYEVCSLLISYSMRNYGNDFPIRFYNPDYSFSDDKVLETIPLICLREANDSLLEFFLTHGQYELERLRACSSKKFERLMERLFTQNPSQKILSFFFNSFKKLDVSEPSEFFCGCVTNRVGIDLLEILIEHGCDPSETSKDGKSPFISACENELVDVALALLKHIPSSKLELSHAHTGSALYYAVYTTDLRVITEVLNKGAELHKLGPSGRYPAEAVINKDKPDEVIIRVLKTLKLYGYDFTKERKDVSSKHSEKQMNFAEIFILLSINKKESILKFLASDLGIDVRPDRLDEKKYKAYCKLR